MKSISRLWFKYLTPILVIIMLLTVALLGAFATQNEDGTRTYNGRAPIYSTADEQALCEAKAGIDAAVSGSNVPQDASSGCAPTDLPQMGALPYYRVAMSTPTEFYNSVNGKGFNEGYGLQCVAGFKQFMFALSGKYIATSTGGASGYAAQKGQIEALGFKWHSGKAGLQNGDWGIFGGGAYGHVAMHYDGKWFGQNQGASNASAGNAFNIKDLGSYADTIIGYFRPNIYQKIASAPAASPTANANKNTQSNQVSPTPNNTSVYTVKSNDTLGGISLNNGWWNSAAGLYGDTGYAQRLAEYNGLVNRGLIYPGQTIKRSE